MATRAVASAAEALGALDERRFDCVAIEVVSSENAGIEATIEIVRQCGTREIPVVLWTPRELSEEAEDRLDRMCRAVPCRRVKSGERFLDSATLFLHCPMPRLPAGTREDLEALYSSDAVLSGKRVLIVDDDIRNIFAITSVLERQNMDVLSAETGKEAIQKLQETQGIDIVLMDIMMPDMDGYDTMRAIRRIDRLKTLPIIAVTAKAMKGDREKTLQAGAWDYLAKPVDTEHMLSVLRAWLHR